MFYEYINRKEPYFVSENPAGIEYPVHIHQMLETVHVLKGSVVMRIGKDCCTLYPGDIGFIFPNVIHDYSVSPHTQKEDTALFIINIRPDILPFFKEALLNKRPRNPILISHQVHPDIRFVENRLRNITYSREFLPLISSLNSIILSRAFPYLNLSIPKYDAPQNLASEVLAYIDTHFTEDISQSSVASQFGVSSSALSRIFTNTLEINYNHYLNSLRINHAKYLLTIDRELPITTVAFECGYQNQQTFNRIFKSFTNCTPKEYRKELSKDTSPLETDDHRN